MCGVVRASCHCKHRLRHGDVDPQRRAICVATYRKPLRAGAQFSMLSTFTALCGLGQNLDVSGSPCFHFPGHILGLFH